MSGDMFHHRQAGTRRVFHNGTQVILAEDDEALRTFLASALRREGYAVVECRSGMDLVRRIGDDVLARRPIDYDLAILDVRMPGVSGLEALEAMRGLEGWPPTILITAFGHEALHEQARQLGAAASFDKPFDMGDFLDAVRRLLEHPDDPGEAPAA